MDYKLLQKQLFDENKKPSQRIIAKKFPAGLKKSYIHFKTDRHTFQPCLFLPTHPVIANIQISFESMLTNSSLMRQIIVLNSEIVYISQLFVFSLNCSKCTFGVSQNLIR